MPTSPLAPLLQHLRRAASPTDGGLTDGQLLEAFVTARDEAAFEALVRRHGPMVLGVCCRILRDTHDAEDAFQATFLVLARKAGSIHKQPSVGSWLYGVAYRISRQAQRRLARQGRREHPRPEALPERPDPYPEPGQEVSLREALAILDEELGRLPEKFRAPVVLCYLQGKTNEEAARELGCPAGTVFSRLSRGREMLRHRLTRRGMVLSASVLARLADPNAAPAGALVLSTFKAALR